MGEQYRYSGYYTAGYLEVQEAKYSTDKEQAIECLTAMQSEQEHMRGQIYRSYGKLDYDTCARKDKKKILRMYESIYLQTSNKGIKATNIQKGIGHKDEFLTSYGESRGERYIDVLGNRRE